jgi:cell division protein FtsQ
MKSPIATPSFLRKRREPAERRLRSRVLTRLGACLFLLATVMHGLVIGGHLDYRNSPWQRVPGQIAGALGFAAGDIRITGLVHQEPESVLAAIGVNPGGSLIGFEAGQAKKLLENLDWVASANVLRIFPNRLDIVVAEREPFAIWQRDGAHYVIDKSGVAMSTLDPKRMASLLLVTGEGAHLAAADLERDLAAVPDIGIRVKAAARVGQRRWTLFLDNGLTVALPEKDPISAIQLMARLEKSEGILEKGVENIDLRLDGRIIIAIATVDKPDKAKSAEKMKLSQNQ